MHLYRYLPLLALLAGCRQNDASPSDTGGGLVRVKTVTTTYGYNPDYFTVLELTYDAGDPSRLAATKVTDSKGVLRGTATYRYPDGQRHFMVTHWSNQYGTPSTSVDSILVDADRAVQAVYTRGPSDSTFSEEHMTYDADKQLKKVWNRWTYGSKTQSSWYQLNWTDGNPVALIDSPRNTPSTTTYDRSKRSQLGEEGRQSDFYRFGGYAHALVATNMVKSVALSGSGTMEYQYSFDNQGRVSTLTKRDVNGFELVHRYTYY